MRVSIEVPDVYAEAIRWELARRGYASDKGQVARVLRHCITATADTDWWRVIGKTLWMKGNPADRNPYQASDVAPIPAEVIAEAS